MSFMYGLFIPFHQRTKFSTHNHYTFAIDHERSIIPLHVRLKAIVGSQCTKEQRDRDSKKMEEPHLDLLSDQKKIQYWTRRDFCSITLPWSSHATSPQISAAVEDRPPDLRFTERYH